MAGEPPVDFEVDDEAYLRYKHERLREFWETRMQEVRPSSPWTARRADLVLMQPQVATMQPKIDAGGSAAGGRRASGHGAAGEGLGGQAP